MKLIYSTKMEYFIHNAKGILDRNKFYLANDWIYIAIPYNTRWISHTGALLKTAVDYNYYSYSETLGLFRYPTPSERDELKSFGLRA